MRFLAAFGIIAVAEMATFFWVESRVGLGAALGLALATAFIGSVLVRRVGLAVFERFVQKLRQGRIPGRELGDGAMVLVAGAFLISPGFITDTFGFLLLIPPVRELICRVVSKRLAGRVTVMTPGFQTTSDGGGEVIDVDPDG